MYFVQASRGLFIGNESCWMFRGCIRRNGSKLGVPVDGAAFESPERAILARCIQFVLKIQEKYNRKNNIPANAKTQMQELLKYQWIYRPVTGYQSTQTNKKGPFSFFYIFRSSSASIRGFLALIFKIFNMLTSYLWFIEY